MLSSSDFLHLPAAILGDTYEDSIATWIDQAATLEPDDEAVQKNIVAYRYWESVTNKLMLEPAKQSTLAHSDEFTDTQLTYAQGQMAKFSKLVANYIDTGSSGFYQAVY